MSFKPWFRIRHGLWCTACDWYVWDTTKRYYGVAVSQKQGRFRCQSCGSTETHLVTIKE